MQHVIAGPDSSLNITETQAECLCAIDAIYACPDCDNEDPGLNVRTYHLTDDETGWDEVYKELRRLLRPERAPEVVPCTGEYDCDCDTCVEEFAEQARDEIEAENAWLRAAENAGWDDDPRSF